MLIEITYLTEAYMTAMIELNEEEIEKMKSGKLFSHDNEELIKKIVDESEFYYIIPSSVDLEEINATHMEGNWPFEYTETKIIES